MPLSSLTSRLTSFFFFLICYFFFFLVILGCIAIKFYFQIVFICCVATMNVVSFLVLDCILACAVVVCIGKSGNAPWFGTKMCTRGNRTWIRDRDLFFFFHWNISLWERNRSEPKLAAKQNHSGAAHPAAPSNYFYCSNLTWTLLHGSLFFLLFFFFYFFNVSFFPSLLFFTHTPQKVQLIVFMVSLMNVNVTTMSNYGVPFVTSSSGCQ